MADEDELNDDEIPELPEAELEEEEEDDDLLLPDEDGVIPALPGEEDLKKNGFHDPEADESDDEDDSDGNP